MNNGKNFSLAADAFGTYLTTLTDVHGEIAYLCGAMLFTALCNGSYRIKISDTGIDRDAFAAIPGVFAEYDGTTIQPKPLIINGEYIHINKYLKAEISLVKNLQKLISRNALEIISADADDTDLLLTDAFARKGGGKLHIVTASAAESAEIKERFPVLHTLTSRELSAGMPLENSADRVLLWQSQRLTPMQISAVSAETGKAKLIICGDPDKVESNFTHRYFASLTVLPKITTIRKRPNTILESLKKGNALPEKLDFFDSSKIAAGNVLSNFKGDTIVTMGYSSVMSPEKIKKLVPHADCVNLFQLKKEKLTDVLIILPGKLPDHFVFDQLLPVLNPARKKISVFGNPEIWQEIVNRRISAASATADACKEFIEMIYFKNTNQE